MGGPDETRLLVGACPFCGDVVIDAAQMADAEPNVAQAVHAAVDKHLATHVDEMTAEPATATCPSCGSNQAVTMPSGTRACPECGWARS